MRQVIEIYALTEARGFIGAPYIGGRGFQRVFRGHLVYGPHSHPASDLVLDDGCCDVVIARPDGPLENDHIDPPMVYMLPLGAP